MAEYKDTLAQIAEETARLDELEVELSKSRKNLSSTMRMLYRARADIFELLFGSDSFESLVSNIHYATRIASEQTDAIHAVTKSQKEQTVRLARLELLRDEQEVKLVEV